jgi:hypothetical protein
MADAVRIWVEISHHPAFRCGGWAFVASEKGALTGAAGGERTPSPERIALAGLVEAVKELPPKAGLEIHSACAPVLALPKRLAIFATGAEAPADDLELWAQLSTVLGKREVRFQRAVNEPRTPTAFAAAWAELAQDKAKAAGAFRAVIPKTNLAKARV